jgi:hypothetical protein
MVSVIRSAPPQPFNWVSERSVILSGIESMFAIGVETIFGEPLPQEANISALPITSADFKKGIFIIFINYF